MSPNLSALGFPIYNGRANCKLDYNGSILKSEVMYKSHVEVQILNYLLKYDFYDNS